MRPRRMRAKGILAAAIVAPLTAGSLTATTSAALAEDSGATSVTKASFLWGVNGQYQGGNPANSSCNFFSAGEQLTYAAKQGNAQVVHDSGERLTLSSESSKCTGSSGAAFKQFMLLTNGTGTASPRTGEASIQWDGAILANAYGGLVPWSMSELDLNVDASGKGTLMATLGGFGSSMENPDVLFPLEKQRVILATFPSITVTEHGIIVQPDYAGVEVTVPEVGGVPQNRTVEGWGSWPQSVVDFHIKSGLSSYWYSSAGAADATKGAAAFTVQFDGPPEVVTTATPPVITTQTKVQVAQPVINGRSVTVTAAVSNAESIRWERSLTSSSKSEYTTIAGQDSETLSFTAAPEWNAKYVRMVATNGGGTAVSTPVMILTSEFRALQFNSQPTPVIAFSGYPARLIAVPTGYPGAVQAKNRVEISHDEGTTWQVIAGTEGASNAASAFVIPKTTADQDGALIRASATSSEGRALGEPGATVSSDPVRLSVLPSNADGPQLAVVTDGPVDVKTDTTVTIVGSDYSLPAWSETDPTRQAYPDIALFETDAWQPGNGGLERIDGITYSLDTWVSGTSLGQGQLVRQNGTFSFTATIPAGTLAPDHTYGVGSYNRSNDSATGNNTWNDRSGDAWAPLVLVEQPGSEFVPDEAELTEANRGDVSVPTKPVAGSTIDIAVGDAHVGNEVQVFMFSEPISLGTPTVGANGTIRVTLPATAIDNHKVAVYAADNTLIGWDDVTIVASTTGGTGTDPEVTGGTGTQGPAVSHNAAVGATHGLAVTGTDGMSGALSIALLITALGGAALVVARRSRQV